MPNVIDLKSYRKKRRKRSKTKNKIPNTLLEEIGSDIANLLLKVSLLEAGRTEK